MASRSLLPDREDGQELDKWVRQVNMRKRMLQLFGAVIFLGLLVIEFQQQFSASPFYLFVAAFALVLTWILTDYMTSKVETARSNEEWAAIEARDGRKADNE